MIHEWLSLHDGTPRDGSIIWTRDATKAVALAIWNGLHFYFAEHPDTEVSPTPIEWQPVARPCDSLRIILAAGALGGLIAGRMADGQDVPWGDVVPLAWDAADAMIEYERG